MPSLHVAVSDWSNRCGAQRPQACRSGQSRVIQAFSRLFGLGMRIAEQHVSVTAFRPGTFDRNPKETPMQWSQPAFEDIRFGFEITMYVSNR